MEVGFGKEEGRQGGRKEGRKGGGEGGREESEVSDREDISSFIIC